jgi:hypothetical protein
MVRRVVPPNSQRAVFILPVIGVKAIVSRNVFSDMEHAAVNDLSLDSQKIEGLSGLEV